MVMTIVPFYKHGRPWSDHGQLMVISWSTMVNDHDRPWSNHGRPWSDHDPVARVCYSEQFSAHLLKIIKTHQNTLEHLDLSITGITLQHWHKYLKAADFPNLKKISYPVQFSDKTRSPFSKIYTAEDKEVLMQCFVQTLKHGKVEEINMDTLDEGGFLSGWDAVVANALKDQILQGKTRHLKKIPLDLIFVNEQYHSGYNLENITDDIETLMRQCSELTHLKFHFSRGTIPSEQFGKLIKHYSNQIISIQCEITDTIAELISSNCVNLTALDVSGHSELSDKGLLVFCNLLKLENLHLKIENKDLTKGFLRLLSSCMCNLKQLSLVLPWNFYNETKVYSLISHHSCALQSLALITSETDDRYCPGINCNTFIKGILKIISTCPPLKCLSLQMFNFPGDVNWEEETADNVLHCIIKYQSMLDKLTFSIGEMSPSPSLMKHVISCMPYCEIRDE